MLAKPSPDVFVVPLIGTRPLEYLYVKGTPETLAPSNLTPTLTDLVNLSSRVTLILAKSQKMSMFEITP